jgi:hypothetical protein
MTVTLFGDWDRMNRWKQSIRGGRWLGDMLQDLSKFGDEVKDMVTGHIDRQDLPWPELSGSTIKAKGFDTIYVETGAYRNSIRKFVTKRGSGMSLVVRVTGTHPGSGLSMSELGTYLEFGTSTIPARPLWGPVLAEIKSDPNFAEVLKLSKVFGFRR